jgi:hypothetical protein
MAFYRQLHQIIKSLYNTSKVHCREPVVEQTRAAQPSTLHPPSAWPYRLARRARPARALVFARPLRLRGLKASGLYKIYRLPTGLSRALGTKAARAIPPYGAVLL